MIICIPMLCTTELILPYGHIADLERLSLYGIDFYYGKIHRNKIPDENKLYFRLYNAAFKNRTFNNHITITLPLKSNDN